MSFNALEFVDEPGVTYNITIWVPGKDIFRDSNGVNMSSAHQLSGFPTGYDSMTNWKMNLNEKGVASGGTASGVAPHTIGPMEDHDVIKDGNPFQAGITSSADGSQIAVKIAADPHNRFYKTIYTVLFIINITNGS